MDSATARTRLDAMLCDCTLHRVLVDQQGAVLNYGRGTNTISADLRAALIVRDQGCRFPGCGRPQAWCDAHHVRHWARGGSTSLGNLVLLCRRHHRLIHQGGFRVVMREGTPVFSRPDDSPLEDRAPP